MRAPSVSRPGSPRRSPPPTFSAGCARPSNVTTSDAPQRKGCEGRARNGENGPVSYPALPAVPEVPSHRLDFLTSRQILDQARAALHAARLALHALEHGAPTEGQLARLRQVVIECRRRSDEHPSELQSLI